MMRIPACLLSLAVAGHIYGQTAGQNYVRTKTMLSADGTKYTSSAVIYDGFGRPIGTASNGLGESGRYVYTLQELNSRGKVVKDWLPVVGDNEPEKISVNNIGAFSEATYHDSKAFSLYEYDALGRKTSALMPGVAWHNANRRTTFAYGQNAEHSVNIYSATDEPEYSLRKWMGYNKDRYRYVRMTDEDSSFVEVYRDMYGDKILERRNGGNDTYFVYDDYRRLRFVLSPEYQKAGYKDKYAYEYRYDSRGNIVKKIMPGCEYTQYWYDAADRMAFMQDAVLRERGLYRFFLYDIFGRLAIQGTCKDCTRATCLNTARFSAEGGLWHTGYNIPYAQYITDPDIEIINYYDSHDFLALYCEELGCAAADFQGTDLCSMTKPTGSLYVSSRGGRILSAIFYNSHGRASDESRLLLGKRLTTTHTDYSYTGATQKTTVMEYTIRDGKKSLSVSQITENTYSDKTDNLLRTDVTINGKKATTKIISYDDLGRIKSVGNGMGLEPVNYEYDLHGWAKSIKSRAFSESLHYADGTGEPCFNGNISSMKWQTADYPHKRGYAFTYDKLGRLTEAVYGEGEDLADKKNRYNEKVLGYTANSAITRFQRRGRKDDGEYGKIDNLNIKYDGNQLLHVDDDALPTNKYSVFSFIDGANEPKEYEYNGTGALTKDLNRGMTIAYDDLSHPCRIQFNDGNSITYEYSPDGSLLKKTYGEDMTHVPQTYLSDGMATDKMDTIGMPPASITPPTPIYIGTTEYSQNIVYKEGKPSKVLFDGGYCTFDGNGSTPIFHYFIKDHLGNNRAVIREDGAIEQTTHYYHFGGTFNDAGLQPELQQYKYNGKPLDRVAGLDTYDYGARQYFPALPMWDRIDPMAEKFYNISPYVYCKNSPLRYNDIGGAIIKITGDDIAGAFEQISSLFEKTLALRLNEANEIEYEIKDKKKMNKKTERMIGMLDDKDITVNIWTTKDDYTHEEHLFIVGGAFMGNKLDDKGINAFQEVNTNDLNIIDKGFPKGTSLFHEITEAYEGAKISLENKKSSPRAELEGSVYPQAHKRASSQPPVYERYKRDGKIVPSQDNADYTEWYVGSRETKILQRIIKIRNLK